MSSLCRVLGISSLAYNALNTVSIEFATPGGPGVADDGYALCFSDTAWVVSPDSLQVHGVREGGDQFSDTTNALSAPNGVLVHQNGSIWTDDVEFLSLHDVLSTDPYYASSFRTYRCARSLTSALKTDLESTSL
jgi:hypothetical protein